MDAHALRRENAHDFIAGRNIRRDLRAEFAVDGVVLRASLRVNDGPIELTVIGKANDPRKVAMATDLLNARASGEVDPPGRIGVRFSGRISLTAARLSWLRSAYLAAFAALGWRYAFLQCLEPLRAQLADPGTPLLPPLALYNEEAPLGRRRILEVQEPHQLRSLAIVLGNTRCSCLDRFSRSRFTIWPTSRSTLRCWLARPEVVAKKSVAIRTGISP